MFFQIGTIPEGHKRGWKVLIDGKEQKVGRIEISSKFGTLTYGFRPEGYDGWAFLEQGGGGTITLPYTYTLDGELLVGLLLEKRPNMGDQPVWCAIGGFVDPGESHEQAQVREADEESGLSTAQAKEFPSMANNSNRGFFVADAGAHEGVHAYGLLMPFDWLEEEGGGNSWKLKLNTHLDHKKAGDVRFFRWRDAIRQCPDSLARAAIAQLLAEVL